MESYKRSKILIFGSGREWWWEVITYYEVKGSPRSYFSVFSALNNAKKYIDKVTIWRAA